MSEQLLPMPPRAPRRMLQPRKDAIRWRMELAEAQLAYRSTPRWWRIWHRIESRIVGRDAVSKGK